MVQKNEEKVSARPKTPPPPPEGGPPAAAPQLPRVPTAEQVARGKFIWRALLIFNFALGAYMFVMPKKKPVKEDSIKEVEVQPATVETPAPVYEERIILPPPPEPVKVLEPIPEDRQRELFEWMLAEKRKVKPKDRKEKQRIDEEKAILKQFIRKDSIPKF